MNLRQLRYFVAAAEEEHLTRAAARLGIQQPPLSQQISALEKELEVKLFARSSQAVRLNAAGRLFLDDVKKALADIDRAVVRVRKHDIALEGNLRIGFTSSASINAESLSIVQSFRQAHPLVTLRVSEGANHDLLQLVEGEELDVAFVRSSVDRYPTLDFFCLLDEPMVAAIPSSHRLAQTIDDALPFVALEEEPIVLYMQENGSGIGKMIVEAASRDGFELRVVEQTARIISSLQLVAAGFGIAVVPATMRSFHIPTVVYRDFERGSAFTVPLNIASRKQSKTDSVERFLSICKAAASPPV